MPAFEVKLSVSENGRRRPQYNLDTDLNGELTLQDLLEWTKAALIITADQILKEEQAAGFDKEPIVAVDGRTKKPVSQVSPLGQIEFTARSQVSDIMFETYEALLLRSKVLSGRYKSSHFVFYNGQQVATTLRELEIWFAYASPKFKESDIVRFVNVQPYARKLERFGITAQRSKGRSENRRGSTKNAPKPKFVQAPNGTYYLTARAIRSKYKRNSIIKFSFISGSSLGITGSFKNGGRKGKKSAGRPYLYPSITISVQERGTL